MVALATVEPSFAGGASETAPRKLTSYTLDITYTGSVAGGTSEKGTVVTNQTTNVHAGWPIQLGAVLSPADLATKFTWTIDGAGGNGHAAIGGYDPTSGPTYVAYLYQANATGTTFPGTSKYYYYTTSGSETASVSPTVNGVSPAKTTFSVAEPTASVSTVTSGVNVWPASGGFGFGQWMFSPPFGSEPGILFTATPSSNAGFSGKFNWVQVYAPAQTFWDAKGGLLDTEAGAGLDTQFPYGPNPADGDVPFKTDDSPNTNPNPAGMTNGPAAKIVVADHVEMWLIYQPKAVGSIWIPIDAVNWNWGGTDTLVNGTWSLTNGNWSKNPSGQATNLFPEWAGLASMKYTEGP